MNDIKLTKVSIFKICFNTQQKLTSKQATYSFIILKYKIIKTVKKKKKEEEKSSTVFTSNSLVVKSVCTNKTNFDLEMFLN